MKRRNSAGFTMTELMTGLAVIAVLSALAVPTMRSVIENGRIRAAGTSLQSGLSLARAESVRLNTQVEFALTATGWVVRRVPGGQVLHQASGRDAFATGLDISPTPDGATSVTYNAFGRVASAGSITTIEIEASNPSGSSNYRPLTVQVLVGGTVRLCETNADEDNPRACL